MSRLAGNQSSGAERWSSALASAAAVALIGWALISGLSFLPEPHEVRRALTTLSLSPKRPEPAPSPTPSPPPSSPAESAVRSPAKEPAPKDEAGKRNLKNEATQIVAPVLPPLIKPPVVAAPNAGTGAAQNTGASDRAGPGEGAGDHGDGRGTGGTGGRGGDTAVTPPEHLRGRLKFNDLDRDLRRDRVGGDVGVRFRVETDGRVSACRVSRSSGDPRVDATPCPLIRERYRFRPAEDARGRPVASWVEENHGWFYPRED
ncbi:hypothetical protein B2G71_06795 [Novosphingobium sp. PC22D]|uniref:energy transducer TonB n=1 Tax=Novosphingobium sp. PC22D TaxID=1962403 RepID=UPI000BF1DF9A|nr:TonB family protein [Novosphingobium sp. PC22D]PEQ13156.1 hypothetical protein B2G71_06795 [Novosphingobium sp. PC22D]